MTGNNSAVPKGWNVLCPVKTCDSTFGYGNFTTHITQRHGKDVRVESDALKAAHKKNWIYIRVDQIDTHLLFMISRLDGAVPPGSNIRRRLLGTVQPVDDPGDKTKEQAVENASDKVSNKKTSLKKSPIAVSDDNNEDEDDDGVGEGELTTDLTTAHLRPLTGLQRPSRRRPQPPDSSLSSPCRKRVKNLATTRDETEEPEPEKHNLVEKQEESEGEESALVYISRRARAAGAREAAITLREQALYRGIDTLEAERRVLEAREAAVVAREVAVEHNFEQLEGILVEARDRGIEIASAALEQLLITRASVGDIERTEPQEAAPHLGGLCGDRAG